MTIHDPILSWAENSTMTDKDDSVKPKPTQSQTKLLQYIEDLRRNEYFMQKISRLKELMNTDEHEKASHTEEVGMDRLFSEYVEYEDELLDRVEKLTHEYNKIIEQLSKDYGIDHDTITTIFMYDISEKDELVQSPVFDLCTVTDNYERDLSDEGQPIPIFLDTYRQSHIRAYPVSIDLHRFASKRDVLDFVDKRWDMIEASLRQYNDEGKPTRFRKRKYDLEIIDYIWANRSMPHSTIAEQLAAKFPDNPHALSYVEVQKIILAEKLRRQGHLRK